MLYHSFEEALLKLKANKDSHSFQSATRKIAGKEEFQKMFGSSYGEIGKGVLEFGPFP